ncbi:hypothetical protein Glove_465g56 [Diversispora epigaea]|uniref:F-box domain-containing protein n=1 Tax=Diversispora epigaea TaxID=1348612 RepID=A0A397GLY6_9GLOM|nr:hypothetical protein Glove_465g56 [Diversispora epigaea]
MLNQKTPKTSLLILPTEILLQITSYLSIIHLKQLSLTNRFLCTLISPYRFKSVIGYNISLFFLRTIVLKYGQYFKSLTLQGQISQEFINRLADLLKILDTHCDRLEVFNIIVNEQTPGILELNPPNFTQKLYRKKSRFLRFTCSAPLITFLAPIYFSQNLYNNNNNNNNNNSLDTSKITDSNFLIHAVIQSVWSLNHYSELYGSQITRVHLSFEGLSDIWISQLIDTCNFLQELILERKYIDDYIEITDSILNELCTLSNLTSLAFISSCDFPLTRQFTGAGWKRMLSGTLKLERLDISGLGLYFTAEILPLIAENYKYRPLWLKHTKNSLNYLPSLNKHEQEILNLIFTCKNNLFALESSYITDSVIRHLIKHSPEIVRLCFGGELLDNSAKSLKMIEKHLLNLDYFCTWNISKRKWPIKLFERFGYKRIFNRLDDDDDDEVDEDNFIDDDNDDDDDLTEDSLYETYDRRNNNNNNRQNRWRRFRSKKKYILNAWICVAIISLISYYLMGQ